MSMELAHSGNEKAPSCKDDAFQKNTRRKLNNDVETISNMDVPVSATANEAKFPWLSTVNKQCNDYVTARPIRNPRMRKAYVNYYDLIRIKARVAKRLGLKGDTREFFYEFLYLLKVHKGNFVDLYEIRWDALSHYSEILEIADNNTQRCFRNLVSSGVMISEGPKGDNTDKGLSESTIDCIKLLLSYLRGDYRITDRPIPRRGRPSTKKPPSKLREVKPVDIKTPLISEGTTPLISEGTPPSNLIFDLQLEELVLGTDKTQLVGCKAKEDVKKNYSKLDIDQIAVLKDIESCFDTTFNMVAFKSNMDWFAKKLESNSLDDMREFASYIRNQNYGRKKFPWSAVYQDAFFNEWEAKNEARFQRRQNKAVRDGEIIREALPESASF